MLEVVGGEGGGVIVSRSACGGGLSDAGKRIPLLHIKSMDH